MAPLNEQDTNTYRQDVALGGQLTASEREKLLKPYLPAPRSRSSSPQPSLVTTQKSKPGHRRRVRPFLRQKLHFLIFFLIQCVFGVYIRFRQIYHSLVYRILAIRHHHHRTPEYIARDVKTLSRLPEHLSVILKFKTEEDGGLEQLMDDVAELCAWSTAAGIPLLSVYEKGGILKTYIPQVEQLVEHKLRAYFGQGTTCPTLRVFAPNHASMNPSRTPSPRIQAMGSNGSGEEKEGRPHLNLLLLSATDGRDTLVDLTRTLAEMAQQNKIRPKDITSNLINTEISATTALPDALSNGTKPAAKTDKDVDAGEPDLLIVFGPIVKLDGYPPWQIRLSEIYCVGDSGGDVSGSGSTRVEYQAFLRALWRYAGAKFNFGR
jgi:dehydrodolichyl diphosphate syntase complex subunit NUS1